VLSNTTIEGLHTLRLQAMASGVIEQREQPDYAALGFEDRLGLLVDRELLARSNRRLTRMLKSAKLKLPAVIEDIDFRRPRGLERQTCCTSPSATGWTSIRRFSSWADRGRKDIPRLRSRALRHPSRAHGALPASPTDVRRARNRPRDGRLSRLMASWARIDVLVIDDFLIRPLNSDQAADLLEVIEDRAQLHSTVVTSQLPVAHWHEAIGDATIADAVLDRLLERANRIELVGESCAGARRRPPRSRGTPSDRSGRFHRSCQPAESLVTPECLLRRSPPSRGVWPSTQL